MLQYVWSRISDGFLLTKIYLKISALILLLILVCPFVSAQQTIINVPSSEILPAGDIIIKQSNRFSPFSDGGYASLTPSFSMGLGHGLEFSSGVGATLRNNTSVKGDFSAKKVWFIGSSTRLTMGGTISPYFSQSGHPDSFLYSHVSQRIKKTKTSVTAGAYLGGYHSSPDNMGLVLGLEQIIIPNKLRLALDWMSGNESLGRLGVGFKYKPHPTVTITSAVIVPNSEADNIAFNVSISKFISLDDENPIKRRLKNVD